MTKKGIYLVVSYVITLLRHASRPIDNLRERFSVFQGDGRSSVAQILFSLKSSGGQGYGHVTCVQVKSDFRGMGLGPILFKEVRNAIRLKPAVMVVQGHIAIFSRGATSNSCVWFDAVISTRCSTVISCERRVLYV